MHIAMIGQKRVPSREGGVEIVVEKLSAGLAEYGHSVTIYNRRAHKSSRSSNLVLHEKIVTKDVFTIERKGIAAISASFSASINAAFGNYDIVHYHAEGPAFFCWIPKLLGKKVVVTIHGLDWMRKKWGKFAGFMIKCGEKAAVRYADQIIVLSENMKAYFMREYDRQTEFIPNGVEDCEIHYDDSRNSYILFLGRLVPEKGVHLLIEAFQKVKDHAPLKDKKLVIAGAPSDTEDYYRDLLKLSKDEERIEFTGFVEGQQLDKLYSNAYLYVLPSFTEGMPLTLLEAMSYGNCCIVSNIPELTEVVGEHGIISLQGDVEDLAEKLLTAPEEIERYRETVCGFIRQKYKWDMVVKKTVELYESVLCMQTGRGIRCKKN